MHFRCRFDDNGKRVNYSMDVLEMSSESKLVKVGSWSDRNRLQILQQSSDVNINAGGNLYNNPKSNQ